MSFVGLHIHSDYSLLDGASQIPQLIDRALELGMSAIALTDHGVMYGAIELIKVCKGKGIKPIIGNEMYVINGDIEYNPKEKKKRHKKFHQVVLAKNTQGYKNLVKLTTISHLKGYQGSGIFARPCINKELLEKYHEGLIVTSACLGGEVPQAILKGDLEQAEKVAKWYQDVFGDDYYLEIQDHGSKEDRVVNVAIVKIARKLGIKIVATNDSHFISCYDVEAHDALLCILTQKRITDDKRLRYSGTEYLKSAAEMKLLFRDHLPDEVISEAINNTVEVADKVKPYNILGEPRIPDYPVPPGHTADSYLEEVTRQGLLDRLKCRSYSEVEPVYRDRLESELKVMQEKGFSTYFLVVWDYIKYARDNDIPVGPGRGCVLGDTQVMLSNGKEISIKDIRLGQEVITHRGNLQTITQKHEYDCDEEIIKLKVSNLELSLTQDHKIWAVKTENCGIDGAKKATVYQPSSTRYCKPKPFPDYSLQWLEAGKLKPNDFVVFPRVPSAESEIVFDLLDFVATKDYLYFDNEFLWYEVETNHLVTKKIPRHIQFNEDLARLLGCYISEGYSRLGEREYVVRFSLSKDETNYAQEIGSLLHRIFGLDPTIIPHKNCHLVVCYSRIVGEFLTAVAGQEANNKQIYDKIITHGKSELIKILIAYLFRGDERVGNREKTTTIKYITKSQVLASQLRLLLARFGYWASIIVKKHKQKSNWHPEFIVKLSGRQLLDWNADFINFPIGIKPQEFLRNESFFVDDRYVYLKIRAVEKIQHTGKVYDISVPEDTSYVGNGISIHNSAAGSLVAYCLKITNIDPIHHGLLFERFLNPERKSMPDIDTDFCPDRRGEMIQYVTDKYGEANVAQIITFNRMTSKAVLKDVGRVLGIDFADQNRIAKMIPVVRGKPTKLKVMISEKTPEPAFKQAYENESVKVYNDKKEEVGTVKVRNWVDMAIRIEGTNKTFGVHAAGVVISSKSLDEIVPLQKNNDGSVITQYYMEDIEALGLLKMDFLGLKNLTTIQRTANLIKQTQDVELDLDRLPLEEHKALEILAKGKQKKLPPDIQKTHNLFRKGNLEGIFQLESDGMKQITKDLKPSGIEDLSSISALYRPGPLDAGLIPKFINRKHGREKVTYQHHLLESILKETYGVMVYQEQIMKIAQELAGYSLGEADLLRRCLSGSTTVVNATTGKPVTLQEIANNPKDWLHKPIFTFNETTQRIEPQEISEIYPNGIKDVWEIVTRTNRKIKATKDHLFYTLLGWQSLKHFTPGDRIGLAKTLPINYGSDVSEPNTPLGSGKINWASFAVKIKSIAYLIEEGTLSTKSFKNSYFCYGNFELIENFNRCSQHLSGSLTATDYQLAPGKIAVNYDAKKGFLSSLNPESIADSDLFWDEIVSIKYIGKEEVFDLTIPHNHNFIANDFIAHNCMGKKKVDEMLKHREKFIDGSARNGVTQDVANELFDEMVLFAEYCLSYDTEIHTVEYGAISIGKIVREQIECTVYTVDNNGFIYTQPVVQWHDRGVQEIFEYTLDNNSVIRATKEHKFMTIDGQMLPIEHIFEQGLELKFYNS